MSAFIFRCPSRHMMVQGWADDEREDKTEYVAYRCPACGGMHLINPKSGKLLVDERDPAKEKKE